MKTFGVCLHCEGGVDLPHRTESDCFRAVDREIKAAQARLRSLAERKGHLLRRRMQQRQRIIAATRRRQKRLSI
jgi:hypothetical protein